MADENESNEPEEQALEQYQGDDFEQADESFQEQQKLGKGPAVAAAPGKRMILGFGGGAIVLFLLYQLIFAESEPPPPPNASTSETQATVAPAQSTAELTQPSFPIPPPVIPQAEPTTAPPLPPLPKNNPIDPQEPEIDFSSRAPNSQEMLKRRQSSIMIMAGGGPTNTNWWQGMGPVRTSASSKVTATNVGDLNTLILQGKVIEATLETAIDSTLPGPLRAIVSRDVYAEAGMTKLIPKGSRLIGSYNTDIVRGQARVFIVWNRVIRPDGIDLSMESPVMDNMGRAGLEGYVDERYFEIFSAALLTSAFTIGTAFAGDAIAPGEVSTTQNTDGSTNTTGDPVSIATTEAASNLASTAQSVLGRFIDTRPIITVDQGTPVKIYVNQDLEFPSYLTGQVQVIR